MCVIVGRKVWWHTATRGGKHPFSSGPANKILSWSFFSSSVSLLCRCFVLTVVGNVLSVCVCVCALDDAHSDPFDAEWSNFKSHFEGFFLFPLQHFTPFRGAYIDLMLIFYPFSLSFGSSCVRVIRRLIAIALILGVVVCLPSLPLSLSPK